MASQIDTKDRGFEGVSQSGNLVSRPSESIAVINRFDGAHHGDPKSGGASHEMAASTVNKKETSQLSTQECSAAAAGQHKSFHFLQERRQAEDLAALFPGGVDAGPNLIWASNDSRQIDRTGDANAERLVEGAATEGSALDGFSGDGQLPRITPKSDDTAERLHREAAQLRREALEIGLAVEQIWLKLRSGSGNNKLSRQLSEARLEIAEQFLREEKRLRDERRELDGLLDNLSQKSDDLRRRQGELGIWFRRRQHDIEEQAARIIAREHELDRREVLLQERESGEQR